MVNSITALGRNGVQDWLIQRVSAVIVGLYTLFLLGFILFNPGLDYSTWHALFANTLMKSATLLTVIALAMHAWVGLWIVLMDYVKSHLMRLLLQLLIIISTLVFVFWTIGILWL